MNLTIGSCFHRKSALDTSLGFRGQDSVPSSDIGSVRAVWPELWNSDGNSDFAAMAFNSRLRGYEQVSELIF